LLNRRPRATSTSNSTAAARFCAAIATGTPDGFKHHQVPPEIGRLIQTRASFASAWLIEITVPVTWALQFHIPFALFDNYAGSLGKVSGQVWRISSSAEDNSHPHWAAWSPVDELNFHLPRCFGVLYFE
jgi:hypothetical protein